MKSKCFIVNGFVPMDSGMNTLHGRVPQSRKKKLMTYEKCGVTPPTEGYSVIGRFSGFGSLSQLIFDIDNRMLLIKSTSQRKAYQLGMFLRDFCRVFRGLPARDGMTEYLVELDSQPTARMTRKQIAALAKRLDDRPPEREFLERQIGTGAGIDKLTMDYVCEMFRRAIRHPRFIAALNHASQSHEIVPGFMTSSYYHFHFRRDRIEESRYVRQKRYLEHKTRYDLSFVSAFRSLEAVFDKPHLKKKELPALLRKIDREFGTSFSNDKWQSFHLIFKARKRWWSYEDILAYFLDLRNAVAAHGNLSPPEALTDDHVLEIQRFSEHLIAGCLLNGQDIDDLLNAKGGD